MPDASTDVRRRPPTTGVPRRPGEVRPMHSDIWYDLAIRELSDLSDPATEKLVEAAADTLPVPPTEEDEPAPASTNQAEPPAKTPTDPDTPARG